MGGTSSRSQVTPVVVSSWTEAQLSEAIKELGPAYEAYGQACVENGITGEVLLQTDEAVLPDVLQDLGVKTMHKTRLALEVKKLKEGSYAVDMEPSSSEGIAASGTTTTALKRFAGFLSHFKHECGTEARLVHQNLKPILQASPVVAGGGAEVFLDSDDLSDLRNLLQHVKETQVLVLLQSKLVLTRPWVMMELFTAVTHDVPIVALNVQKASCPYDYAAASEFLLHFDEEIEIANPGAAQLLIDMGIDPVDVAWRLSDCLPNIISTDFNPNASEKILQASLEDLADAMRKAVPIAPSMSKEEWLAMRATHNSKTGASKKEHGSSSGEVAAADAKAQPTRVLADVPATVPELPNAYLVRGEDISQLRAALLTDGGASGTALTSKKAQTKVGAHGMGGVGKTTIAAALVHDEAIRSLYEKIVWVSVGQEPDIRELQESIHVQLTKQNIPESAKTADVVGAAIRDAAKGSNVLLVLDDVWDPKHEKPLNCIDPDNTSRLLVTTRIRGLLKNASEVDVGVLSPTESFKLLLSSAELNEEDVEPGSDDHRIAGEIVELCGRLPLTLAIAGGMIADNGQGFTEDILEVMRDKQELEDEEGMTVETRVISTSVKMMIKGAGKHKGLVGKVFHFFACFPEDVPVPAPFFNKMAPLLSDDTNENKARLAVGSCLGTLLKYNLVKGSLSAGSGVFMHDIVRDYVINRHSSEELRVLQRSVTDTVLAARPEPDGFPTSEFAVAGFEGYVSRQLYYHLRGALHGEQEPLDVWLCHPDNGVRANVAMAAGLETLTMLSVKREAAGDLVKAAHISWTASMAKDIDPPTLLKLSIRVADLLERADDTDALDFEMAVLNLLSLRELKEKNDLQTRRGQRLKDLSSKREATFDSKWAEGTTEFVDGCSKLGVWAVGSDVDLAASIDAMRRSTLAWTEAYELSEHPSLRNMKALISAHMCSLWAPVGSGLDGWNPDSLECSEAGLVDAIDLYDFQVCGKALRGSGMGIDWFLGGAFTIVLALWYGNFDAINVWHEKTMRAFEEIGAPQGYMEIHLEFMVGIPILIMLGLNKRADDLLKVFGFTYDPDGFKRFEDWFGTASHFVEALAINQAYSVMARFFIYLSSPKGSIDEIEFNDWIPSPQEIAEIERGHPWLRGFNFFDVVSFGASTFLKLGRDDDAYELSRIAVSPEQGTIKKTTLVSCHCVLGEVAARRGDLEEAESHFANALNEAKLSRLPMLEALVAQHWSLKSETYSEADAVIAGACARMDKTLEHIAPVLESARCIWDRDRRPAV